MGRWHGKRHPPALGNPVPGARYAAGFVLAAVALTCGCGRYDYDPRGDGAGIARDATADAGSDSASSGDAGGMDATARDAGFDAGAPDPRPPGSVGEACTEAPECVGPGAECISASSYTGGFCTRACVVDADCGSGAACGMLPRACSDCCMRTCTTDADCRDSEGYRCDVDAGACVP